MDGEKNNTTYCKSDKIECSKIMLFVVSVVNGYKKIKLIEFI